jgi:Arc/MetJ family transcription regulator
MAKRARLKRTSLFIDSSALARARRALGAASDADAVRLSLERVVEMERFWRFMAKSRRLLRPGSFGAV